VKNTLLTAGLVCVIGAIIGGGFKAFGIEVPIIPSLRRQTGLALIGVLLLGAAYFSEADSIPARARCDAVPKLKLNEICAEGKYCDGREDFVEIYNPTDSPADLRCYVVVDEKQHRKDLSGTLVAKAVRAWSRSELGFGLSREGDKVSLIRMQQGGGESVEDSREITDAQTYQQRIPDGGDRWEGMSHQSVKAVGNVGSRNAHNKRLTSR
jgi:hypothetical protein